MASAEFTVGILLCGKFRDFLEQCKFLDMDIEYIESSGWIDREFTIKGNDSDILAITNHLKQFITENNLKT